MPVVNEIDIMTAYIRGVEASSIRKGDEVVWEHYTRVDPFTSSAQGIQIPDWALSVGVAVIGGGGGGQSGNGANGSSGRPGAAAEWSVSHLILNRNPGDKFYINLTVGNGGAGGGDSNHSHGSQGQATKATIFRNINGTVAQVATYTGVGGQGGPDSGIEVGGTSGSPSIKTAPRQALMPPTTLPRGSGVGKEQTGGSPGAGGGYGGGGFFGSMGTGRAGGKGRAIFYYYGLPY